MLRNILTKQLPLLLRSNNCSSQQKLNSNVLKKSARALTSSTMNPKPLEPNEKIVVNSNLTLLKYRKIDTTKPLQSEKRTLVIMFGWMQSSDKNLAKYAEIYARYNFDVLLVKTTPSQMVLPKNGSVKVAQYVLDFFKQNNHNYDQMVVHGFSIGGYQFGEVLAKLTENPDIAQKFNPKVKALIFDSAVDLKTIPRGFSKAITRSVILQNFLFLLMHLYLKLAYFVATKYYIVSEREYNAMKHFVVPALMFVSQRDQVGSVESNQIVMDNWIKRGLPVTMKIFDNSKHVSHFMKYPDEYEREIVRVLKEAKLL